MDRAHFTSSRFRRSLFLVLFRMLFTSKVYHADSSLADAPSTGIGSSARFWAHARCWPMPYSPRFMHYEVKYGWQGVNADSAGKRFTPEGKDVCTATKVSSLSS